MVDQLSSEPREPKSESWKEGAKGVATTIPSRKSLRPWTAIERLEIFLRFFSWVCRSFALRHHTNIAVGTVIATVSFLRSVYHLPTIAHLFNTTSYHIFRFTNKPRFFFFPTPNITNSIPSPKTHHAHTSKITNNPHLHPKYNPQRRPQTLHSFP